MTSQQKIAANRLNAKRSTGPRTLNGKHISSQNALKHGLAVPIERTASREIATLARAIVADCGSGEVLTSALEMAAAEIDLHRVRSTLTRQMDAQLRADMHSFDPHVAQRERSRLARYERRAHSRLRSGLKKLESLAVENRTAGP
jgi:hypothetical protein